MEMALVKAEMVLRNEKYEQRDVHILVSFPIEDKNDQLFEKIVRCACETLAYNLTFNPIESNKELIEDLYQEAIKCVPEDHDSDEYPEAITYLALTLDKALESVHGKTYTMKYNRRAYTFTSDYICIYAKSWISTPFRPGFVESIDTE